MTKINLAKLIISCFDFQTVKEFDNLINYLKICLFHIENPEKADDIENAMFYVMDKKNVLSPEKWTQNA